MLQRTANLEVLREVILPVEADHRLALHTIFRVRFQRHVDAGACVDDALIEDGHLTGRVIDAIVGTFRQRDTACGDDHRTLRHIVSTQRDDVSCGAFKLTHQQEFVLVGHLARSSSRGVVQLLEGVFVGYVFRHAIEYQEVFQRCAEGLCRREEHTAVGNGVTLNVVEIAVGVNLVVIVETVAAQSAQQGDVLHFRYIRKVHARSVALVFDVETELGLLNVRRQIIDVFHHQRPVSLLGIVRRVLQRLHVECLTGVVVFFGKLTHLVFHSAVGIAEGNGQHLVSLQRGLQREIAQRRVQGVFR